MSNQTGELPHGWAITTLSEVTASKSGNSKLIKGKLHQEPAPGRYQGFSASGPDVWCDTWEHEGDAIIVSAVGARCGKAFIASGRWSAIANTHIVRPTPGVLDPRYSLFLMNNESFWVKSGSAQAFVKVRETFDRPFHLPPIAEQRRIVAKIEELQARSRTAHETLEAIPPLLDKFRQSVLAAAFRGDLTAEWRAQNPDLEPASVLLERIRAERRRSWEEGELEKMRAKGKVPKDNGWKQKYQEPEPLDEVELPQLPTDWCWVALEELANRVTDGTHQPPPFTESGIPFLVIRNVINGHIEWDTVSKWVSPETHKVFTAGRRPCYGDVLYTAVGSYGVAVEVDDNRPFMFQRHIAHVKPTRGALDAGYITLALNAPFSRDQADEVARGVAQKTVTLGALRRFAIPLPPEREQHEIVSRLQSALQRVSSPNEIAKTSAGELQRVNKAILIKAFRGELVPQDPNDEPASVLLERIRTERSVVKPQQKSRAGARG